MSETITSGHLGGGSANRRSRFFYSECIVISVEGVLYKLPRERLELFSDVFKDLFCLPQAEDVQEGKGEDNPIVLSGCTSSQFENLLEILIPSAIPYPVLSKEQLIDAYQLADQWEMDGIKEFIRSQMAKKNLSPVEKILLGEKLHVPSWVKEGYIALVKMPRLPPTYEIIELGWAAIGHIAYARESFIAQPEYSKIVTIETSALRCSHCRDVPVQVHCGSGKHAKLSDGFANPGLVYAQRGWYAPLRTVDAALATSPEEEEAVEAKVWATLVETLASAGVKME